jgi:hypothetical protein
MNTNKIKSFAKEARIQLYKGVANQLLFWGFDDKGNVNAEPEAIPGGFTFRGTVYNDVATVPKWKKLKEKVQKSKESIKDVTEEAAYTWFNRLAAIRILEENNFIDPVLCFQQGSRVPMILQQAKSGQHAVTNNVQKANLQEALLQNDDEKAFAILITQYCNAHPLLKEVFGHLDDYTEILVPNDLLTADGFVAMLNDENNIAPEDFTQVELIGWLYQFYISDRKDEVFKGFKANKKARAEDIPAATQIFTPKWIVNYMVENTVGKIYLDYEEDSELKSHMNYLVQNETDGNSQLIDDITQLTLIDPACGSGHILVTGFEWLYKMYREQGYGAKQAVESILKNNLYGLDLDDRAMQLSRFAILLKAAQQLENAARGEGKTLLGNTLAVLPHVYAFPEEHGFVSEEIANFTNNQYVKEIYQTLDLLRQGKNIGSALKLSLPAEAFAILQKQYEHWQQKSIAGTLDLEQQAIWANLKPYVEVVLVLTQQYVAVVANPPYMGQKSMNGALKEYLDKNYPNSKSDLFAVFMEQMMCFVKDNARMGCITMESWMFLSSYEKLRKSIIDKYSITALGHFGWHILGIAFGTAMLILEKSKNIKIGEYSYLTINGVDRITNVPNIFPIKDNGRFARIPQTNFEKIQGNPIAYWVSEKYLETFKYDALENFVEIKQGLATGDNDTFIRLWSEVDIKRIGFGVENISNAHSKNYRYFPYNKGGGFRKWYGNQYFIIKFDKISFDILSRQGNSLPSRQYYFKEAITWSDVSAGTFASRFSPLGFVFDVKGSSGFSREIHYDLAFLNNKYSTNTLSVLNPTLSYQVGNIKSIPYVVAELQLVSMLSKDNVSISKTDWDSRETSWDFEQNPLLAQQQTSLTLAYQNWREYVSKDFFRLHTNEEELNRIFIDIYGLQEELTPKVALKDITILQDELKADKLTQLEPAYRAGETVVLPIQKEVVISQLLSYLVGCMLGRYRLDKSGLHIAHPNASEEELASYEVAEAALPFKMQIDEDAILPLMGAACAFPDDTVKWAEDILHRIYGDESHIQNLNFIDDALGVKLDKWMTEKFWPYHISGTQYKKKPIYWLFSSNPKKPQTAAFRVLVYMHRMDGYTVQKIMRNYLHPHQEYLRNQYESMKENEANLSKQELKNFENLQKQMIELKEYNEVLKELAAQQITFDLDDGVTVNYGKFEGAVALI